MKHTFDSISCSSACQKLVKLACMLPVGALLQVSAQELQLAQQNVRIIELEAQMAQLQRESGARTPRPNWAALCPDSKVRAATRPLR